MCPFCVATAALVMAKMAFAGGLATLVIRKFRASGDLKDQPGQIKPKEKSQ